MADNRDWRSPGTILLVQKRAASIEPNAEDREQIRRDLKSGCVLRIASTADCPAARAPCGQCERTHVALAIEIVRIRERPGVAELCAERRLFAEREQPRWVSVGQWLEQHPVDEREHHGGGADADRERGNRHGGKSRPRVQRTNRKANVEDEIVEPPRAAGIPARFLDLLDAAELDLRAPSRLVGGAAGLDQVRGVFVDVKLELFSKLLFEPAAMPHARPP